MAFCSTMPPTKSCRRLRRRRSRRRLRYSGKLAGMNRVLVLVAWCAVAFGQQDPQSVEDDWVVRDFVFNSGERLPELKLHYRTLGKPERDAAGRVRNAVLILHGTNGSSAQFLT